MSMIPGVMIDCESFGLQPNAAIITIGAVVFDHERPGVFGEEFHVGINLESSMSYGLGVEADAIIWWLRQSQEARAALLKKINGGVPLTNALAEFDLFLGRVGDPVTWKAWSCGSRDFEWLEHSYRAVKRPIPWYYRTGDYRTLRDAFGRSCDEPPATTSHDALADAKWQAQYLQNLLYRMRHAS